MTSSSWLSVHFLISIGPFIDDIAMQANEGNALKEDESKYYEDLSTRLDLTLSFTEHGRRLANIHSPLF